MYGETMRVPLDVEAKRLNVDVAEATATAVHR
jgi:hypothetical protein